MELTPVAEFLVSDGMVPTSVIIAFLANCSSCASIIKNPMFSSLVVGFIVGDVLERLTPRKLRKWMVAGGFAIAAGFTLARCIKRWRQKV